MKKYIFKPYSKSFPELFEKEKARIAAKVKKNVVIEHVGSTAVPGLGGKGIIDIAMAADKGEMEDISQQLQELGYEFRPKHSTPDRFFLRMDRDDEEEGTRRYHIHLCHPDSGDWKDLLFFRDYLRAHPEEVVKYAQLKQKAAEEVNEDGARYRELKDPAFKSILQKRKGK